MSSDFSPHVHAQAVSAPRRIWRVVAGLLVLCALLGALVSSILFVDETEFVIVERLGHIVAVYDRAEDRGLHVKLPWPISTVRRFDRRTQLFDPPGREVFTSDKKNITIDTFVCWKIASPDSQKRSEKTSEKGDRHPPSRDKIETNTHGTGASPPFQTDSQGLTELTTRPVVRFFRALGSRDVAEARLDSRVRSILSMEIGRIDLSRLMRITDSEAGPGSEPSGMLDQISRSVCEEVKQRPDETESVRERLGIDVVDVRIQRINFPLGNQQAVFERMKSERRKIADRYRSAGMAENTMIKSQADRQYSEILAKAEAEAERIRGAGEAEAISVLNRAHAQDPDFYRVLRTLDTYRKILNERTTLVLSASSDLLKMLTDGVPDIRAKAVPETASHPERTSRDRDSNRASNSRLSPPARPSTSVAPRRTAEDATPKTAKEGANP